MIVVSLSSAAKLVTSVLVNQGIHPYPLPQLGPIFTARYLPDKLFHAFETYCSSCFSSAKKSFKLLTWNIDGLDEQDLKLRTLAVIFQINSLSPDAVYLQEVVPETLELIRRMCKG